MIQVVSMPQKINPRPTVKKNGQYVGFGNSSGLARSQSAGGDVAGGDVAGGDVAGGDVAGGSLAGGEMVVFFSSFIDQLLTAIICLLRRRSSPVSHRRSNSRHPPRYSKQQGTHIINPAVCKSSFGEIPHRLSIRFIPANG